MARNVVERIRAYDAGRAADLVELKYRAMRSSSLAFLRGTAHLFYDDLPRAAILSDAPASWISGDLHVENFGTYRGVDRRVYFDLNDFDEAALAPCTWELLRLCVSLRVAVLPLGLGRKRCRGMAALLVDAYRDALSRGRARCIDRNAAKGMVRTLIDQVRRRRRKSFIGGRTVGHGAGRRIRVDGRHALPAPAKERRAVMAVMRRLAGEQVERALEPIDVARRIAGTGSLGLERYVVLVRGHGSGDGNLLVDLKYEPDPAIRPHLRLPQPRWASQAARVVEIQRRLQAVPPAYLQAVLMRTRSFVLKELQPTADKLRLEGWKGRPQDLEKLVQTLGALAAWSELRSSGREGSAVTEAFVEFGRRGWRDDLLRLADEMTERVEDDWRRFRRAAP